MTVTAADPAADTRPASARASSSRESLTGVRDGLDWCWVGPVIPVTSAPRTRWSLPAARTRGPR